MTTFPSDADIKRALALGRLLGAIEAVEAFKDCPELLPGQLENLFDLKKEIHNEIQKATS
jgi:hypothetical protein